MARTTVSLDDDLLKQAKNNGINVSKTTRDALKGAMNAPTDHWFNTNKRYLPNGQTGAGVYGHGVVATFAKSNRPDDVEKFGGYIGEVEAGDRIFSWENDVGLRGVGNALEDGDSDPVPPEHRLFHDADSAIHEFHVPVNWRAILQPQEAITAREVEQIAGRPVYGSGTHAKLGADDNTQLLWDIAVGRNGR